MENISIENLTLSELQEAKKILEKRLSQLETWVTSQRGRNYEEYCRRELIYHSNESHSKLKRVNNRIEEIIKSL